MQDELKNSAVPANLSKAELPEDERAVIRRVAAGDPSAVAQAKSIYWRRRRDFHDTPELGFMSEFLHPVPDLALRAKYRREVLAHGTSNEAGRAPA